LARCAVGFTVTVKVSGTGDPVVTPAPGPVLIGTRARFIPASPPFHFSLMPMARTTR
jgi:hypothetical protein